MGRKKFIDKKKSATFQLIAKDSSDFNPLAPSSVDRVFIRVDRNPYSTQGFLEDEHEGQDADADLESNRLDATDPNSIFADALGDDSEEGFEIPSFPTRTRTSSASASAAPLPDVLRREILELGFPDDGYNYLLHLREIKNSGAGSSFYHNSKAKLDQVPLDVKAYDASRLQIRQEVNADPNANLVSSVASKTVGVKIQKAVDPDVAALLDDGDLSRFGSDVEELEEDFVLQANIPEEGEEGDEEIGVNENLISVQMQKVDLISGSEVKNYGPERENELSSEKPRVRRLLDEQFDMLTLREYDNGSESDDVGSMASEGEPLAAKLNHALKDYVMDELDLNEEYKVPGDFLHGDEGSIGGKELDPPIDVIRKCAEYAEMYNNENKYNEDLVVVQESSDESEVWDCETIVSTYSNLDNHPGKIQAPMKPRKKLVPTNSAASNNNGNIISLRGKEKLPVDFLPHNKRPAEKTKKVTSMDAGKQKKRPYGEESKEEKKDRKSAVKDEKREARRVKKEMKGLYRSEAQQAQRVSAISGPSSIHLM
eukprot:TRINITY_DN2940_c0_g2_i4.p1 TRINITY_DN2940_c0_g2~~TRINITY_DN2940_c0_g2_i4.p1  ORF type:complete len:540 (+),score=161.49 TRINITY_DN2940_c0_g2_i4:239-1858(+)